MRIVWRSHGCGIVFSAVLTGFACLLQDGCTVGPKYVRPTPPAPIPATFKEAEGWKPVQPSEQTLRGNWWELFGDPQLNTLEEQVNISNQDLKAAEARLRQARALIRVNRASESPTISTAPAINAVRPSDHRPNVPPTPAPAST